MIHATDNILVTRAMTMEIARDVANRDDITAVMIPLDDILILKGRWA